ncbi:MAG TPA: NTP transferase domain-containing protein [Pseudomonadota bacterium]|nr:NTP transferase domain-containing protein [Pseudomonadota bacterium]
MTAAAIVLAAGASQRMGQPKALLPFGGQTLLAGVLQRLCSVDIATTVVAIAEPHGGLLQRELERLGPALVPMRLHWAWNPTPEGGMLSSVQCALAHLLAADSLRLEGALIWPVDIPQVRAETLRLLLAQGRPDGPPVVPTYGERGGHPLWLPRSLFAATLELPPTLGLRELRRRHRELRLPVDDSEILRDLDTPQDLQRLRGE